MPKVIAIVGCPGMGKTSLARAVYNPYVTSAASPCDFDCIAWVEAAGCNDNQTVLLDKILQKVKADLAIRGSHTVVLSDGDSNTASPDLHAILADKRYLVFIDDVRQAKVLKDIIHYHFPENDKTGVVIVTTSVHQVASVCSSGSYAYTMKCLDDTESEKLFCRKAFDSSPEGVGRARLHGTKSIISKCSGLPLAIVSIAQHLSINATNVDRDYCDKLIIDLGSHLAGSNAKEEFKTLRRSLGQCYEALPDYDHKAYMRSLSIFPWDHPIKCKSLIRRLLAEGLVAGDGRECLDELINRCIVEPLQISSCSKDVKSCRVNTGVMMEFIVHKSVSTNFVSLIRGEEVLHNPKGRIRRLSVQSCTRHKYQEVEQENKLSETVRSLTIIPSGGRTELSQKKSCKFLRLLDLEGCRGLDDGFFKDICKLVYLKYLSLRRTDVENIPHEIETRKIGLPIQVMTLPKLAFLFGKLVLPKMFNDTKGFFERKSELHTVAGFVVEKKDVDPIILKAKNLRKIKVWCRDTCAPPPASGSHTAPSTNSSLETNNTDFVSSLQSRFTSLDSVSIQSGQLSQHIMASLEGRPCKISHMELSGKIGRLSGIDTLGRLDTLNKLQLSYTGLTSKELSILQHLPCLEYLKLQDNKEDSWNDSFSVLRDGFESLRRLCFQALKLPELNFEPGPMKSLTSLNLLYRDISKMQMAEKISKSIKHITGLNEVVLHYSATTEIVEAWKIAAMSNPSRPCVKQSSQHRDQ